MLVILYYGTGDLKLFIEIIFTPMHQVHLRSFYLTTLYSMTQTLHLSYDSIIPSFFALLFQFYQIIEN